MPDKTIIALSSAAGVSGISIIRLSGPLCLDVLTGELNCTDKTSHLMHHGIFTDLDSGETLDHLNFVYMKGPKTFTGEDVLEIFPHGNPMLVQSIMDCLLKREKIRWAEPGEFTRRAFENSKIDLMQSEAVHRLIHSTNKTAVQNSLKILQGDLKGPLLEIKKNLKQISIELELDVDFSEEELDPAYHTWKTRISNLHNVLQKLFNSWERGKRLQSEPKIAIFGAPNAGKSSLINCILENNRLLVSDTPGTTRDYIEIPINLKNGKIILIDTAGIGESAVSQLDSRAMEFTENVLTEVDYRICLIDGSLPLNQDRKNLQADFNVLSKKDLPEFKNREGYLSISSNTGEGIHELLDLLDKTLFQTPGDSNETFIATQRQYHCIKSALENANNALQNIDESPEVEILAFEIRECHKNLAELIGEFNTDEILHGIFSEFCIGK